MPAHWDMPYNFHFRYLPRTEAQLEIIDHYIILGQRCHHMPELEIDLSAFSVVLLREVFHRPKIFRICNHHVQNCCLARRRLTGLGYSRIAAMFPRRFESALGYEYMLGVDRFNRETANQPPIPTWQFDTWDTSAFTKWVNKEKIDVLVFNAHAVWETSLTFKTSTGESLCCANFNFPPCRGWSSGIYQNSDFIGETSMDFLPQLRISGERGTCLHPQIVLIDGTWVDGSTQRQPTQH